MVCLQFYHVSAIAVNKPPQTMQTKQKPPVAGRPCGFKESNKWWIIAF